MIIKKDLILPTEGKKPILFDVYYQASAGPKPLVIFCHGYKGFKDWGPWHLVAEAFANAGFCFVKFNFSHNGGTVEQPIDFPDLDAFAENNFSKELDDLERLLTHFDNGCEHLPKIGSKTSLIGHSRGAGIVLIKAKEDARIDNVITWAGVSDFKSRFQEGTDEFEYWKRKGVIFVENSRTKQQLPHNFQFYEDFKSNEERFTLKKVVKGLEKPLLIIHGTDDETVGLNEAQAMQQWSSTAQIEIIADADHVFGGSHPWEDESLPQHLKEAVEKTTDFLE